MKIGSLTHRLYKSFNVCIRNYQSNICKVLWYFVTTLGKPIIIACNHWWSENTILELVWFKGVRIENRHISTYYTRKEILKAQGQSLISYTPGNGHLLLNCPSHWEISSLSMQLWWNSLPVISDKVLLEKQNHYDRSDTLKDESEIWLYTIGGTG